jgi:WD40 repeat protein
VLLAQTEQPIVIFIDEIDSLFAADFSDDFFSMIRACCQHRVDNPAFHRLTFALLGVATPSDLIKDKQRTPFNIGTAINLKGFNLAEVAPLAPGLAPKAEDPQAVLKAVLDWTGGQPFLTQKVCQLIAESPFTITAGSEVELVSQLVQNRIITNWEDQDHPEHLTTIRNRLLADEHQAGRLLGLYQHILQRGGIEADDSPEQMTLRLSGLVVKRHGQLQVYNPVYQAVFTQNWVEQKLATLRPYTEAIAAWLASGCTDESRLLRGQTLKDALAWSTDKSLGDHDYRFLNASREVEERVFRQKNQILEEANRKAKCRIFIGSVGLGIALLGVMGSLVGMGRIGARLDKTRSDLADTELELGRKNSSLEGIQLQVEQLNQQKTDLEEQKSNLEGEKSELQANKDRLESTNQILTNNIEQTEAALGETTDALTSTEGSLAQAQTELTQTEEALDTIKHDLTIAQSEAKRARKGARLERDGRLAMRRFESQQIEGLLLAMEAGSKLNDELIIIKSDRLTFTNSFSRFPAISPISALLHILTEVREYNHFLVSEMPVRSISFSPDGQYIASGSDDGKLRLWDVERGTKFATLTDDGSIRSISFSPDSQTLAFSNNNGIIHIWTIDTNEIETFKAHDGEIWSISFSPDGKNLASGGWDRLIKIWDIQNGLKLNSSYRGHQDVVTSVSFSPDGKMLASGSWDGTVRLWDTTTAKDLFEIPIYRGWTTSVSFSFDSKTLAVGSQDGTITLWDIKTNSKIIDFQAHEGLISNISFKPTIEMGKSRQILASSGADSQVRLWEVPVSCEYCSFSIANKEIGLLWGHQYKVEDISFSPDGEILASGSHDGTLKLWQVGRGIEAYELQEDTLNYERSIESLVFSPDSRTLASLDMIDQKVTLWDIETGEKIAILNDKQDQVSSIDFSTDGQTLASGDRQGIVKLWNVNSGMEIRSIKGHQYEIESIAFSATDKILASAGGLEGLIKIWDTETGEEVGTLLTDNKWIKSISFGSDDTILASGHTDGTITIWNTTTGAKNRTFRGHQMPVREIDFSPSGQLLASGSDDGTVKIWSVDKDEALNTLYGHIGGISSIDFSPDGKTLVSASQDGILKIWDLEAGEEIISLQGHDFGIESVRFSPNGYFLASGDIHGSIRLWPMRLADWLTLGCNWLESYFITHPDDLGRLPVCQ